MFSESCAMLLDFIGVRIHKRAECVRVSQNNIIHVVYCLLCPRGQNRNCAVCGMHKGVDSDTCVINRTNARDYDLRMIGFVSIKG